MTAQHKQIYVALFDAGNDRLRGPALENLEIYVNFGGAKLVFDGLQIRFCLCLPHLPIQWIDGSVIPVGWRFDDVQYGEPGVKPTGQRHRMRQYTLGQSGPVQWGKNVGENGVTSRHSFAASLAVNGVYKRLR